MRTAGFVFLVLLGVTVAERSRFRDCRQERLDLREDKSDIILTGTVDKVDRHQPDEEYGAQVLVKRVIKPLEQDAGIDLKAGKVIRLEGFGTDEFCDDEVRPKDSRIFLLKYLPNNRMLKLNATLLRITVHNLRRISAALKGEPYKRSVIVDEPCEKKYCPYNADCKVNERKGTAECQCITTCPVGYQPVCGSNNVTYPNECQMKRESCSKKIKVYVKHQGACQIQRN